MKLGALFASSSSPSSSTRPSAAEPSPPTDAPHRSKLASFSPARHMRCRTPRKSAAPAATSPSFSSLKPPSLPVTPATPKSPATPLTSVGSPAAGDAGTRGKIAQPAIILPIAPAHHRHHPVAQKPAEGSTSGPSPPLALSSSPISLSPMGSSNVALNPASLSTPTRTLPNSLSSHLDQRSRLPRPSSYGSSLSPHSPEDPPTRMTRSGSLYSTGTSNSTPRTRNCAPPDSTPTTPTPAPDPNELGSELPAQLMDLTIAYGDGLVTADEYRTLRTALLCAAVQADTSTSYLNLADLVPIPASTPGPERSASLSSQRSVHPSTRLLGSRRGMRPGSIFSSHPPSSEHAPEEEGNTSSVRTTRTRSILNSRARSSTWVSSGSVLSSSTIGSNGTTSSDKREADQHLKKQIQSDRQTAALAKATAMMDPASETSNSKRDTSFSSLLAPAPAPAPRQTAKPRAHLQAELAIIEAERKDVLRSIELVLQHYGRSLPSAASAAAQTSPYPSRTYAPRARSGLMHTNLRAEEGPRKRDSACETLVAPAEQASQSTESLGSSSVRTVHRHSFVDLLRRPSSKTSIPSSNPSRPASARRSSVVASEPRISNAPDSQSGHEQGDDVIRIWSAVAKRYDDRTALL